VTAVFTTVVWLSPEVPLTVLARAAVPLAATVMVAVPAVTVRTLFPAVLPSVQVVLARPLASDVALAGETVPPPVVTANVTVAPGRGWSSLPRTRTWMGAGSVWPATPT
jgi:hypothetical protein